MSNYLSGQMQIAQSQAFWDTGRLNNLKLNSNDPKNIKAAAKEFASLMFHMMIKSMRDAEKSLKSELSSSNEYKYYNDMMDQQWAMHLAHTDHNQIVDTIVEQFTKNQPKVEHNNQNIISKEVVKTNTETNFTSKDDFIKTLMPYVQKLGKFLSVDPKILIAQAALETGWGTKIAKLPSGESSNNLFGIKAGNNWQGKKVATKTTEYQNNILSRKTDVFRAYNNFKESIQDYINFIGGKKTLQNIKDPAAYTKTLQDVGYATDPNYANKIMAIYNSMR